MDRPIFLLLLLSVCKTDDEASALLDDDDLPKLLIQEDALDPASSRVAGLAGVVPAATEVTVRDVSGGLVASGTSLDNGSFAVAVTSGARQDVYELSVPGDEEPLGVALTAAGTVARAWGEGFGSEVGCELHGWSGIIGEDEALPVDRCRLDALLEDGRAVVHGPVPSLGAGASTELRVRTLVQLDDEQIPSIDVALAEEDGTEHVVSWIPEGAAAYEDHSSALALDAPDVVGTTIVSMSIRSSAASRLVVSDVSWIGVTPPP